MESLFRRDASGISSNPQSVHNLSGIPRIVAHLPGYSHNVKGLITYKVREWHHEEPSRLSDLATRGRLLVCMHAIIKREVLLKVLKGEVLLEDLTSDPNEYVSQLCECTNLYHINREQYSQRMRPKELRDSRAVPARITQIISILLAAPGSMAAPSRRFPHETVRKALKDFQYPLCRHTKISSMPVIRSYSSQKLPCRNHGACTCDTGLDKVPQYTTCPHDECTVAWRFVVIHAICDDISGGETPIDTLAIEHIREYPELETGTHASWQNTAILWHEHVRVTWPELVTSWKSHSERILEGWRAYWADIVGSQTVANHGQVQYHECENYEANAMDLITKPPPYTP